MLPESTLLTTKLHRPPVDVTWVARPALLNRLQQGLTGKLILISAPAGFGKTSLISQWIDQFSVPNLADGLNKATHHPPSTIPYAKCCWLSLD
ncbi:MAG TPA: hypothetical protein PKE45_01150, partial [Caldilineaceae bacterium]|nr:hypothetical protein [Caldilineaceae bacterium]